jgi:CheY-like chemotaxis protein
MAPQGPYVLVVEDDVEIRQVLCDVLVDEGLQVAAVSDGREALAFLEAHPPPALILLDLMLPVMSGDDFRKEQLARPALAAIPVVVLTAGEPTHHQATIATAQGVLRKPVHLDALLEAIHRFV